MYGLLMTSAWWMACVRLIGCLSVLRSRRCASAARPGGPIAHSLPGICGYCVGYKCRLCVRRRALSRFNHSPFSFATPHILILSLMRQGHKSFFRMVWLNFLFCSLCRTMPGNGWRKERVEAMKRDEFLEKDPMAKTHDSNATPAASHYTHTNRLSKETSPYLLQHAHNPVDWYPWGEEALRKAKEEDKPILLSVGYSACHWCHVMERESFENEDIAAIMNQHFVSIKVDREERPDIDNIYMQAVQALTHQGGWPMTVFLTPDGRPSYGGTYFPPQDRHGMPGFPRVLLSVANAYQTHRQQIEEQATELASYLQQSSAVSFRGRASRPGGPLPLDRLSPAIGALASDFDARYGGFGHAPKFPNSMALEFLLRMHLHVSRGEVSAEQAKAAHAPLEMVEPPRRHMAKGGINAQRGGASPRYWVDQEWLVPHFEKMLY